MKKTKAMLLVSTVWLSSCGKLGDHVAKRSENEPQTVKGTETHSVNPGNPESITNLNPVDLSVYVYRKGQGSAYAGTDYSFEGKLANGGEFEVPPTQLAHTVLSFQVDQANLFDGENYEVYNNKLKIYTAADSQEIETKGFCWDYRPMDPKYGCVAQIDSPENSDRLDSLRNTDLKLVLTKPDGSFKSLVFRFK